MQRVTTKLLYELVEMLNRDLPGRDFSLGCAYGGYRLERKHGSVDVSQRLKAGELELFLRGMLEGICEGTRP